MKLTTALIAAATAHKVARQADDSDRRYFQLKNMMVYYNNDFDERKYWTYGCNCHFLGDRPMSDPGFGPPVDRLDGVCKQYKDCNKCAREKFGESCVGEIVLYRYGANVSFIEMTIMSFYESIRGSSSDANTY